jgi:hypothetical protein
MASVIGLPVVDLGALHARSGMRESLSLSAGCIVLGLTLGDRVRSIFAVLLIRTGATMRVFAGNEHDVGRFRASGVTTPAKPTIWR